MKPRLPRLFYLIMGWFFTVIGLIGIPVPGLPTTPFLLLASFFFVRSSKKFFIFLLKLPVAGPRLKRYLKGFGMTLGEKIGAITIGWLGMGAGWYFGMRDRPWSIYMFAGLALIQLIAMIRIKTYKPVKAVTEENHEEEIETNFEDKPPVKTDSSLAVFSAETGTQSSSNPENDAKEKKRVSP
jgi:uncharacterized membrane protein YbaN (DUF454 family)